LNKQSKKKRKKKEKGIRLKKRETKEDEFLFEINIEESAIKKLR
jgi:hypothetical protein